MTNLSWLTQRLSEPFGEACVEWPFARVGDYGQVWDGRRTQRASRLALEIAQPWHPPLGSLALHSCDNPPCINPRHLSWGTQERNMRECRERGRARGRDTSHCIAGHPLDESNAYLTSRGRRNCRACGNRRSAEYRARRQLLAHVPDDAP